MWVEQNLQSNAMARTPWSGGRLGVGKSSMLALCALFSASALLEGMSYYHITCF